MKILHTGDWHIGSFKGPEKDGVNLRSLDTAKCLEEMVRVAEAEKPELALVSGDVFDRAEIWQGRSHKEVLQARNIIIGLAKSCGKVIVMRGTPNHDSAEAFDELQAHFELVPNVEIVITPQVIQTEEFDIAVLPGFDRGTFRAKFPGLGKEEEHEVLTKELANSVLGLKAQCEPGKKSILMSHYTIPGCNTESGQVMMLTQFEPVLLPECLIAAGFDLIAMGHIHRPQKLPNLENCYYCGAINAMTFNDERQERGFWIHEYTPDGWSRTFHQTPYREFITFHFTDTDITALNFGHLDEIAFNWWRYNGGVQGKIVRILYTYTGQLGEAKIGFTDFWKESTYTTEQNKIHPCYLITKKGCEFIAHKLTGEKGTRFTALYINRFHEMEDALMEQPGEYPSMHDIVDAMSRQTKIITNLVGRIEKLEQRKGYAALLPAGDRDGSAHNEIAKRADRLGDIVGEVARLTGYPKNIIFRAMYEKLGMEFGISLDVYLYVARKEYRADACTLHAVVMWDRLYERAVQINQEEIAKRKVYS